MMHAFIFINYLPGVAMISTMDDEPIEARTSSADFRLKTFKLMVCLSW